MSSVSSSRAASGSATPTTPQQSSVDIYRPLAKAITRPLAPFLPSTNDTPSLPTLLSLDTQSYSSRLAGKHLLLEGPHAPLSDLVTGKKRHRGDPEARARARREAEEKEEARREAGIVGERKRRKLGGIVRKSSRISYQALLPLHYLHCTYLSNLLSLPPLPPSSSPNSTLPGPSTLPSHPLLGTSESIQSHMTKADFTGSSLAIIASRNPFLVGIRGIVIEETASTFRLVSPDDKVRVIPKNGTQFDLSFPAYTLPESVTRSQAASDGPGEIGRVEVEEVEHHHAICPRISLSLLGTSFGFRSGDRAGRKFRPAQGGGGGSGWGEEWVKGEWSDVLHAMEARGQGGGPGASRDVERPSHNARRKRGKSRRKDPPTWGRLEEVMS